MSFQFSFFKKSSPQEAEKGVSKEEEKEEEPLSPEEIASRELKGMECRDTISLNGRGLRELPQGLLHHKETLEGLNFSRNNAPKISLIADFQKLKRLDLSECNLTEIENEVFLLRLLESLDVSHNKLTAIGDMICNLHHLTTFNGSNNTILSITPWIGHTLSLKALNLSYNAVNFITDMCMHTQQTL